MAGALLVAFMVSVATNGDGKDQADSDTTVPDEHAARTTAKDPAPSGNDEPASTTTGPADTTTISPGATRGGGVGDGRWTVSEDIQPGRYIAAEINGDNCDWARLSEVAGDAAIAAETNVANQAIVDILSSDAAFRSNGCGTWTTYAAPDPPPSTTIDQGDWVIGEQIEPGAYRVPQAATCTWIRAAGFEHTPQEVTQTENTNIALEGPFLVTLTAGERFTTQGCDPWTKAN